MFVFLEASPATRSAARVPNPISARRRRGSAWSPRTPSRKRSTGHRASNLVQYFPHRVRRFEETKDGVICEDRSVEDRRSHRIGTPNICSPATAPAAERDASAGIEMVGPATLAVMPNEYWRGDLSRLPLAREAAGFMVYSRTSPACRRAPDPQHQWSGTAWLSLIQIGLGRRTIASGLGPKQNYRNHPRACRRSRSRCDLAQPLDLAHEHARSRRLPEGSGIPGRRRRASLSADRRFRPNSGVQDAHNLAWKLAFVLAGLARRQACSTATTCERRPVAQSNANFSFGNMVRVQAGSTMRVRIPATRPHPLLGQRPRQSPAQHRPEPRTQLRRRARSFRTAPSRRR